MTGPMTERELLAVWDDGAARLIWQKVRSKAIAEDSAGRLARAEQLLAELPAPLAALAANAALVRRLVGSRWFVIMLAREDGATWEQVAEALETTADEVIGAYMAAITSQEKYVGAPLHDALRARAVLTRTGAQEAS